jgi:hypothetical protein
LFTTPGTSALNVVLTPQLLPTLVLGVLMQTIGTGKSKSTPVVELLTVGRKRKLAVRSALVLALQPGKQGGDGAAPPVPGVEYQPGAVLGL